LGSNLENLEGSGTSGNAENKKVLKSTAGDMTEREVDLDKKSNEEAGLTKWRHIIDKVIGNTQQVKTSLSFIHSVNTVECH
jgi:hypothetical protein